MRDFESLGEVFGGTANILDKRGPDRGLPYVQRPTFAGQAKATPSGRGRSLNVGR